MPVLSLERLQRQGLVRAVALPVQHRDRFGGARRPRQPGRGGGREFGGEQPMNVPPTHITGHRSPLISLYTNSLSMAERGCQETSACNAPCVLPRSSRAHIDKSWPCGRDSRTAAWRRRGDLDRPRARRLGRRLRGSVLRQWGAERCANLAICPQSRHARGSAQSSFRRSSLSKAASLGSRRWITLSMPSWRAISTAPTRPRAMPRRR